MDQRTQDSPSEIALVGDLTDSEAELTDKLLSVEPGGACTMYIDSPGGSPYCAMSLMSLIRLRGLQVTGVVTGECSSAALWPFAACVRRLVTPYSVLLFHPMKWQSEEHVGLAEAAEWARHFGFLETEMDRLLAEMLNIPYEAMHAWIHPGRYVTGSEVAAFGAAELIELTPLAKFRGNGAARGDANATAPANKPRESLSPRAPSDTAHARELAQIVDRLVHLGRFHAALATLPIARREERQFLEVLRGFEPLAGSGAQGAVAQRLGFHVMFDQPESARRDVAFERFEGRRHMIARVERLAHVVQEGGEEEFLVVGDRVASQVEDL